MDIPILGDDAEGNLCSGFGTLVSNRMDLISNNGNCNCNCRCGSNGNSECKCTTSTTKKPFCNTKTSSSMHSIFLDSFHLIIAYG